MDNPQLQLFKRTVPRRPYCTDELASGVRIQDRAVALVRRYVQINGPRYVRWLAFDVDREGAAWDWQDRALAPPNIAVENPKTKHAHLLYALSWPLPKAPELKYTKQLRYGAAVETAYLAALEADPGYTGFLVQNPASPAWNAIYWEREPYDLAWLSDWTGIDLHRYADGRTKLPEYGLGRNCTLFANLRKWAYRAIRKEGWPARERWGRIVTARALEINTFPAPLPVPEVRAIARSVARWTFDNITREGLASFAKRRNARSLEVRRARAEEKRQLVLKFSEWDVRTVSRITGIPKSTVQRLRKGAKP